MNIFSILAAAAAEPEPIPQENIMITISAIIGAFYIIARAIVWITPTPRDDAALKKVAFWLKLINAISGLDLKQGIKKFSPVIIIGFFLLLGPTVHATDANSVQQGFTIWGLSEQRLDDQSQLIGRIGYVFKDPLFEDSKNALEVFVGSHWLQTQNTETGKTDPPQMATFGMLYEMTNLIDPNKPLVPIISDALSALVPDRYAAYPYLGWQGTWAFADDDVGLHGPLIGLLCNEKTAKKTKDHVDFVVEYQYNNFIMNLSDLKIDDDWLLSVGLRLRF